MIEIRFVKRETGQQVLDTVEFPLTDRVSVLQAYCDRMRYDAEVVNLFHRR